MNLDDNKDRVPIPKWKALSQTPSSELVSSLSLKPSEEIALNRIDRARALYERWRATPSLDNAFELLDCSNFLEDVALLYGPASQILSSQEVTKTSRMIAGRVLHRASITPEPAGEPNDLESIRQTIRNNRRRLIDETRNSMLYAEQARLYTMIGENRCAERAFNTALGLSPDNRHILRSYCRFMDHLGGPNWALKRLHKSHGINEDPWLQAAEIALSEVAGKPSRTARAAASNIDSGRVKLGHASELASALATLERSVGNKKKFNKRFGQSLVKPSDNALAQAMWFVRKSSSEIELEDINSFWLQALRTSNEALTYSFLQGKQWDKATQSFLNWQQEESFSTHIAIQGSYHVISFANDYETAITMCKRGLEANWQSHILLNNCCVAQRRAGLLADADVSLRALKKTYPSWSADAVYLATDAMMLFALGKFEEGRRRYVDALEQTSASPEAGVRLRVKMHWIYEEALAARITKGEVEELVSRFEAVEAFGRLSEDSKEYWSRMKLQMWGQFDEFNIFTAPERASSIRIENYI